MGSGGPVAGALQASIDDAIAAGGQWADLTSDGAVAMEDIGVLGGMMQMQGGGGAGGCGPADPICQFQRAVEIAYDYRNQMVEYTDLDNLRTHRYHYDRRVAVATCFGRRVAKVVDHGSASAKTTRFACGGQASWQVLAEFDGFQPWDTAPLATYVFGNYISKSRRGDDEPIQMRRDLDGPSGGQQPQDFYYHPDELFSVVAITNTGGAVVERVRYGDYGNVAVTDPSGGPLGDTSTIGNRFAFTGREYDEETDLSYYRTRYLEHEWGRFTTRDWIGIWGDGANVGNAIGYVGSRPAIDLDPLGLLSIESVTPGTVQLIAQGISAKELAAILGISVFVAQALIDQQKIREQVDRLVERLSRQARGGGDCERAKDALRQAEDSIDSYNRRISEHRDKVADPHGCGGVPQQGQPGYHPARRDGVVRHWEKEIENFEKEIEITRRAIEALKKAMRAACFRWHKPWTWFS